ncbi:hypothetical protein [Vibrio mediterranei]|uniref:hypothetical protein n=1 Tax=Vibrio mediterranei TaxID=689 RepID=UPI004067CA8E
MNNNTFLIEASGPFLTEHLTVELLKGDEEVLFDFIREHLGKTVEDYEPEIVFDMIDNLAGSLERFVKHNETAIVASWLNQNIELNDLDVLSNSASADIWYDAEDHNDAEAAAIITDTQNAMSTVSSKLHTVMVGGDDE